jgi:hypothetical protein
MQNHPSPTFALLLTYPSIRESLNLYTRLKYYFRKCFKKLDAKFNNTVPKGDTTLCHENANS